MTKGALGRIPNHLRLYVVEQDYEKYTARDQAAWRFIMRQAREYFAIHAHPVYLRGLEETGIDISQIPKIIDMDMKLSKFGWGAVCIRGFIPSAAFLDFLAHRILPVAADMRTLEHIHYTPAPDIVHEAAGHAPILADAEYRSYLSRYAFLAKKAISSDEDILVFEAVRSLSDLKENPDATQREISEAERRLSKTVDSVSWVSESAKVLRMSWWTTEYGLIGPTANGNRENLKIYGAGLLSSVGESAEIYDDKIKKIPLSLDCVEYGIDITEPQAQLFVARDFDHLNQILTDLEETMSFKIGGMHGINVARKSNAVTTTELDSGVMVSGILVDAKTKNGSPYFLKWSSKCQLSHLETELAGQGVARHPHGFSSPIGRWVGVDKHPAELTVKELDALGFTVGQRVGIEFESGVIVNGLLANMLFLENKLALITLEDATAQCDGETLYDPSWGPFDMIVGSIVTSVFGGPADWASYGDYSIGEVSTQPGRQSPFSDYEKKLFESYKCVRSMRDLRKIDSVKLKEIIETLLEEDSKEWLLAIEIFEISQINPTQITPSLERNLSQLKEQVLDTSKYEKQTSSMIKRGLELVSVLD